jgi:cytochrome o ubiquinol oxidase subunit 3
MSTLSSPTAAVDTRTDRTVFGFWVYLMTDCLLFGALFATYAVLHNNTAGGASGKELFDLPFVLVETLILLTSSFACGVGLLAARAGRKKSVVFWFGLTFALGLAFLVMELTEFSHLIADGNDWTRSGFLSGFFTLVATHGLHIAIGLLWMIVLGWQLFRRGLNGGLLRRLTIFSMFWHFLDVVWIFIFTIVYMIGALQL